MSNFRKLVVGATMVGLLGLPVAAIAQPSAAPSKAPEHRVCTHGPVPATRHATSVEFLFFDHIRGYGTTTAIRGQVIANVGAGSGSVPGATVRLYRKINGTSSWIYLGQDRTTYPSSAPKFDFRVRSKANADYKVVMLATHRCKRSSNTTSVSVYRHFHAHLEDVSGRFHGRVTPNYAHHRIFLQKRTCADCGWSAARAAKTGRHGRWSFMVGAPRHGRWWWRVSTPASTTFIASHSSVFTTQRSR
jgi:hypothetical protein